MKILFVCLGNICRSPTAHAVMEKKLAEKNIDWVRVDSAGTAAYHIGKSPDSRTQSAALSRGYDLSTLRARQVKADDFHEFDYIFAMDHQNLLELKNRQPKSSRAQLMLALSYSKLGIAEVPDPYYGGADGFNEVLDICETLSDDILANLFQETRQ